MRASSYHTTTQRVSILLSVEDLWEVLADGLLKHRKVLEYIERTFHVEGGAFEIISCKMKESGVEVVIANENNDTTAETLLPVKDGA